MKFEYIFPANQHYEGTSRGGGGMSLPGDIPCLTPCQNISCPYCAFGACMDNTPCDDRQA